MNYGVRVNIGRATAEMEVHNEINLVAVLSDVIGVPTSQINLDNVSLQVTEPGDDRIHLQVSFIPGKPENTPTMFASIYIVEK